MQWEKMKKMPNVFLHNGINQEKIVFEKFALRQMFSLH